MGPAKMKVNISVLVKEMSKKYLSIVVELGSQEFHLPRKKLSRGLKR